MTTVKIEYNSEFTARAEAEPSWTNGVKTKGYNFSYPVLNTTDIANLLMDGGKIIIKAERMGTAVWTFDTDTSTLSITKKGETAEHKISDVEALFHAMIAYYHEHGDQIKKKGIHPKRGNNTGVQKTGESPNNKNTLPDEEFRQLVSSILYPVNCKALKMYPKLYKISSKQCNMLLEQKKITPAVAKRIFFKGSDLEFFTKVYKEGHDYDLFDNIEVGYFNALIREFNIQRREMTGES